MNENTTKYIGKNNFETLTKEPKYQSLWKHTDNREYVIFSNDSNLNTLLSNDGIESFDYPNKNCNIKIYLKHVE